MITLRPYQEDSLERIWNYFSSGQTGNPLIAYPTGTGKSAIPAVFIQRIMKVFPNQRFLMITHVKELIEQNYEVIKYAWPEAPVGIYSAGLKRKEVAHPIIYAGIQSAIKNPSIFGHRDIIFIDEAHLVSQEDNSMYLTFISTMRLLNPKIKVIGLTATPFRMGQGLLTDDGLFTDIIHDLTDLQNFNRLIAEGYLAPLIPKRTHTELDISGVGIQKGDFIGSQLEKAVDIAGITHNALKETCDVGANRRSWLIFASGIEHANHIAATLTTFGVDCASVHSKQSNHYNDAAIKAFKNNRLRSIVNFGKLCLDEKTEILTNNGWRGIDTILNDDLIAAWSEQQIEFTKPLFIIKRERLSNETMVSIKGRRRNIRVTSNHRMLYSTYPWNFKEASAIELVNKQIYIPISGEARPFTYTPTVNQNDYRRGRNINTLVSIYRKKYNWSWETARSEAEKYTEYKEKYCKTKSPIELSIEECLFIGFWLGDGTRANERFSVSQSRAYPFIIEWFDDLLSKLHFHFTKSIYKPDKKSKYESTRWNFSTGKGGIGQQISGGIAHLNEYLNKEGCDFYWSLSCQQIEALMYGFWMADGNHGDGKVQTTTRITGTQIKLYELLQSILVCRGYNASITINKPTINPNHSNVYSLNWRKGTVSKLTNELLKEETLFIKERVWCVTSTTSFIITRREGKVTVMGNTTGFNHPNIDLISDLRPTMSIPLHIQKLGRGTRPADGKRDCIVLDFGRNVPRLGPINDPFIPKKKGEGSGDVPVKICENCGVYNHAKVRFCVGCGHEFQFQVKIVPKSGTDQILRDETPLIEMFDVDRVIYNRFDSKNGKAPYIRATYSCGLRQFNQFVFPEGTGYSKHLFHNWWKQRHITEPPPNTNIAMQYLTQLREPKRIRVWINRKYPEIVGVEF